MGLLLPHIYEISIHSDMVSIYPKIDHTPNGGGKRDEIKVFSKESRYRLFRLMHSVTYKTVTFVTLTYPREFPNEIKISKRHLAEYRRRFEEKYGAFKTIWRLEFQKRGAPHYHLLYFDCPYIPKQEWSALWADVVHSNSDNHRKSGVDIKLVTDRISAELISAYVGKYVAKKDTRDQKKVTQKPGRWWGKWNIEEPEPEKIEVSEREAEAFISGLLLSRKRSDWVPPDPLTCTVFGEYMGTDRTKVLAKGIVERVKGQFEPSHGKK